VNKTGSESAIALPPVNSDTISACEERAFRAWPAEGVLRQAGWSIRHDTRSTTRRTRSVLAGHLDETINVDVLLEQTEAFYGNLGLPARFQITPASCPNDLDARLDDRGYLTEAPTVVEWAICHEIDDPGVPSFDIRVMDDASDDWLDTYRCGLAGDLDLNGRRAILKRIRQPKALVELWIGGVVASIGLGVFDSGWLGIFCMFTREEYRAKGYAYQVLGALCRWNLDQGGEYLYLQVEEDNPAARSLYEKYGFIHAYDYHYRTLSH